MNILNKSIIFLSGLILIELSTADKNERPNTLTWNSDSDVHIFKSAEEDLIFVAFFRDKVFALISVAHNKILTVNIETETVCKIHESIPLSSNFDFIATCADDDDSEEVDDNELYEFMESFRPVIGKISLPSLLTEIRAEFYIYNDWIKFMYPGSQSVTTNHDLKFKLQLEKAVYGILQSINPEIQRKILSALDMAELFDADSVTETVIILAERGLPFLKSANDSMLLMNNLNDIVSIISSFESELNETGELRNHLEKLTQGKGEDINSNLENFMAQVIGKDNVAKFFGNEFSLNSEVDKTGSNFDSNSKSTDDVVSKKRKRDTLSV